MAFGPVSQMHTARPAFNDQAPPWSRAVRRQDGACELTLTRDDTRGRVLLCDAGGCARSNGGDGNCSRRFEGDRKAERSGRCCRGRCSWDGSSCCGSSGASGSGSGIGSDPSWVPDTASGCFCRRGWFGECWSGFGAVRAGLGAIGRGVVFHCEYASTPRSAHVLRPRNYEKSLAVS